MVRWPQDTGRTIRVRIDTADSLPNWTQNDRARVVTALQRWEMTPIPFHFELVSPDSNADVTVCWVERFPERYSGWTSLSSDADGWIRGASVELALLDPSGHPLDDATRDAVVLHELGHAIGLWHASDPASIMWPVAKGKRGLSAIDSSTVRGLYGAGARSGVMSQTMSRTSSRIRMTAQ